MPLDEPSWWYGAGQIPARLLAPLSWAYGQIAVARFSRARPYRSALPVICVGNFTAGGTGKTPTAIAIAALLKSWGRQPAFLSRGYGGSLKGPHWVDGAADLANAVGDEPLLLARHGPTMIARDRQAGARAIEQGVPQYDQKPDVIIMDDGMQNPALVKDVSLALVSAARGIGNGRVIPAGPLRAPLAFQLKLVDAVIYTGAGAPKGHEARRGVSEGYEFDGPVLRAAPQAAADLSWLRDKPVLAYAGIAAPERFFDLLQKAGAVIAARRSFKDHQPLRAHEATDLLAEAATLDAQIVTTQKDLVRLGDQPALRNLRARSRSVAITMVFDAASRRALERLLRPIVAPA